MKLTGKTAVVTDGGRGIGRAHCERLAAEGANVVVVDIEEAAPILVALRGSGDKTAMFPVADFKTITLDVWRRVQAVNVEPLLLFAQAFVPGMAAAHWGRIVSTGSSITLSQQQHDLAYVTSTVVKTKDLVDRTANALSFLFSGDAGFITGQILHVDGGSAEAARRFNT